MFFRWVGLMMNSWWGARMVALILLYCLIDKQLVWRVKAIFRRKDGRRHMSFPSCWILWSDFGCEVIGFFLLAPARRSLHEDHGGLVTRGIFQTSQDHPNSIQNTENSVNCVLFNLGWFAARKSDFFDWLIWRFCSWKEAPSGSTCSYDSYGSKIAKMLDSHVAKNIQHTDAACQGRAFSRANATGISVCQGFRSHDGVLQDMHGTGSQGRHTSHWHREHDFLNIQTMTSTWNARTTSFCYVHLFGSLGRGTWYFGMHTLFVKQSWPVNQPLIHTHLRNKGNQICSMLESTSLAVPPRDDQVDYSKSSLLSLDRCIMKLTQIVNQTGDISTTFANPLG